MGWMFAGAAASSAAARARAGAAGQRGGAPRLVGHARRALAGHGAGGAALTLGGRAVPRPRAHPLLRLLRHRGDAGRAGAAAAVGHPLAAHSARRAARRGASAGAHPHRARRPRSAGSADRRRRRADPRSWPPICARAISSSSSTWRATSAAGRIHDGAGPAAPRAGPRPAAARCSICTRAASSTTTPSAARARARPGRAAVLIRRGWRRRRRWCCDNRRAGR